MDVLDLAARPAGAPASAGARSLEVMLLGGFCGALGFWVVSFRLSYARRVARARAAARARGRGAGRRAAAAGRAPAGGSWPPLAGRARRRATSGSARTPPPRWRSPGCSASARCWRCSRTRRRGSRSCCSATRWRPTTATSPPRPCSRWPAAACSRRSTGRWPRVAFDPGAAGPLGISAPRSAPRCWCCSALAVAVAVQGLGQPAGAGGGRGAAGGAARPRRAARAGRWLAGGSWPPSAGAAGIYASFHLGAAAGACVALALCGRGGRACALPVAGAARPRGAGAGRRPQQPDGAGGDHRDAHELGRVRPSDHRVVAADRTRPAAARGRPARGRARTGRPGRSGRAACQSDERDEAHGERLVDRRRMHLLRGRHGALGVGHRPRQVRLARRSRRRPRAGSRPGRSRSRARAPAPPRRAARSPRKPRQRPRAARRPRRPRGRRTRPGPEPEKTLPSRSSETSSQFWIR